MQKDLEEEGEETLAQPRLWVCEGSVSVASGLWDRFTHRRQEFRQ